VRTATTAKPGALARTRRAKRRWESMGEGKGARWEEAGDQDEQPSDDRGRVLSGSLVLGTCSYTLSERRGCEVDRHRCCNCSRCASGCNSFYGHTIRSLRWDSSAGSDAENSTMGKRCPGNGTWLRVEPVCDRSRWSGTEGNERAGGIRAETGPPRVFGAQAPPHRGLLRARRFSPSGAPTARAPPATRCRGC